jgi:hypothetical protein
MTSLYHKSSNLSRNSDEFVKTLGNVKVQITKPIIKNYMFVNFEADVYIRQTTKVCSAQQRLCGLVFMGVRRVWQTVNPELTTTSE